MVELGLVLLSLAVVMVMWRLHTLFKAVLKLFAAVGAIFEILMTVGNIQKLQQEGIEAIGETELDRTIQREFKKIVDGM